MAVQSAVRRALSRLEIKDRSDETLPSGSLHESPVRIAGAQVSSFCLTGNQLVPYG